MRTRGPYSRATSSRWVSSAESQAIVRTVSGSTALSRTRQTSEGPEVVIHGVPRSALGPVFSAPDFSGQ